MLSGGGLVGCEAQSATQTNSADSSEKRRPTNSGELVEAGLSQQQCSY